MDIHKPKPWHGVREFLREYLIVVVGVLTALGGEQAAQSLNRRVEVAEARQAVRSEIAANLAGALASMDAARCDNGNLDRWVAWANGGPRPPPNVHGYFEPQTSTWEAVQAGAGAHMALEERRGYTRFYDNARAVTGNTELEIPLLLRLVGHRERAALTQADAQRLLGDLAEVRMVATIRYGNILGMVQKAKAMGVRPEPMSASARAELGADCGPPGIAAISPAS